MKPMKAKHLSGKHIGRFVACALGSGTLAAIRHNGVAVEVRIWTANSKWIEGSLDRKESISVNTTK